MRIRHLAIAFLALGAFAPARAQMLSATGGIGIASSRVFRGQDIPGGLTMPVQPWATWENRDLGVSAGFFGSWPTRNSTSVGGDEVDAFLSYDRSVTPLIGVTGGFTFYNRTADRSIEVTAGGTYAMVGRPSLAINYDTKRKLYFALGGSHPFLHNGWLVDLDGTLGIGSGNGFTGLQDATVGARTYIFVGPVALSPSVSVAVPLTDKVNTAAFEIWGGLSLSYSYIP